MSDINYEMIDQYLEGELSGEALLAFEQEMKTNPALAKEVDLYRKINEEMSMQVQQEKEEQALSGNLKKLNEQYFKKSSGKIRSFNRWWYAGITAAAAVVLIFIINPFAGSSFNNEKLYADYMNEVEALPGGQRGEPDDSLLIKVAELYNKKDYVHALPLLTNILSKKPNEIQLKLALGVSYLQTGQIDTAIFVFDEIASGVSIFKNEAIWYKALLALKQNRLDDSYQLLESLSADAGRNKDVKRLMKKIDTQRKTK
jgi:hypothetical protein